METKWMEMEIKWKKSETENNLIAQTMEFPDKYWPVPIFGGDEKNVFRRSWKTSLSATTIPKGIWTFIGLDRGDIVEGDIEVWTQKGLPLVLRSFHKEALGNFDAWQFNPIEYIGPIRRLRVGTTCRVNGKNVIHGGLQARFHIGIIIVGYMSD